MVKLGALNLVGAIAATFVATIAPEVVAAAPSPHWTEAFGISPAPLVGAGVPIHRVNGTIRFTFRVSVSGTALRLRLSNEIADEATVVDAASVSIADKDGDKATERRMSITFSGRTSAIVAAGAPVLTDPIPLPVKPTDEITVSIYSTTGVPISPLGATAMMVAPGDQTAKADPADAKSIAGRPFVSAALVATARNVSVIVSFGDSLTDGARRNANDLHGYPEALARRFQALAPGSRDAVVNAGISGNRVLSDLLGSSAQARLDRDALRVDGVRYLILLEGINDIGASGDAKYKGPAVTADSLIAGFKQIIVRAHARGIKVIGGTLMPFRGAQYFSEDRERIRLAVNKWIRASGDYDGVIDFEAAVRDPRDPSRYRHDLDSGDHLHPNGKGYQAMGDAIDLRLFR